ncbi:MAG: 3-keto-disaccharide hydrolase [Planctomycetota bacterium]
MEIRLAVPLLLAAGLVGLGALPPAGDQDPAKKPGYDDTPMLTGQNWKVHDRERPQRPRVTPGATWGAPPADAVVLFDGSNLDAWQSGNGEDAKWAVANGVATVNGTGDIRTHKAFGDCQLHIEWATPADPQGSSQGMGNSGVYLMGLYEIQVLDSHDNLSYVDGSAGAMYGQWPPLVNASRPSGEWQCYDILFRGPRFAKDGSLERPASITVLHNGVAVQVHRELLGPTVHRRVANYNQPHAEELPLKLQDHGNPVRYRNIWIRPLGDDQEL